MPSEEFYFKLLLKSGISNAEISELVKKQIDKMKGLINEETALFIIAKERGLNTDEHKIMASTDKDYAISELDDTKRNVNIVGRIVDFMAPRKFNKKDGTISYWSNFWIKDASGEIKILLWDDRAKYVEHEDFKTNEIVRILNGYVKKNRDGEIELHVGNRGDVEINPNDVDNKKYPKINQKDDLRNISDFTIQMRRASVQGTVILIYDLRIFDRKNSLEKGKVQRIIIKDDSGDIPVVFWNEDTNKLREITEGTKILITNLNLKTQFRNKDKLELHYQNGSSFKIIEEAGKNNDKFIKTTSIDETLNQDGIFNIQGEVVNIENIREIEFKDGRKSKLLALDLSDDTGAIKITFWGEEAEKNNDLKLGENIKLNKVEIKRSNFSNRNEGTFHRRSQLERNLNLNFEKVHKIPSQTSNKSGGNFKGNYTNLKDINKEGYVEIKGFILKEINRITVYEACSVCNKKVDNCKCSEGAKDTEYRMIINPIVDDGTDTMRVTFIGDNAEKLLNLEPIDVKIKIDGEEANDFFKEISLDLMGKDLAILGKAKYSDYSEAWEIIVNDFKPLDPEEEVKRAISEIET